MTRRRWIGVALAVVAAAVVGWAVHDRSDDGSALRSNGANVFGSVESGRPFAYGSLVVYNRESEPVVLRHVRLSGRTPNLRLIGSYAVHPRNAVNLARSFPRGVDRRRSTALWSSRTRAESRSCSSWSRVAGEPAP